MGSPPGPHGVASSKTLRLRACSGTQVSGTPTRLKTSQYTRLVPADDGWKLLYNALTNAFARVPPSWQDAVQEILLDPGGSAATPSRRLG